MNKKFLMFLLFFFNVSSNISDDYSDDESFVSVKPSENILKSFFTGIFFTTKNGLKIKYYGGRFSKKYLLSFIMGCASQEDEYALLSSLGFYSLSLNKNVLEIQDFLNLESVTFVVSYRDDNLIKSKVYDENSNKVASYYGQYLQVCGINLNDQVLHPISFKSLNFAVEKLTLHFLRLGYSHVDIGYDIVKDEKSRSLKVVYKIDLDGLKANTLEITGGEERLNLSLLKNWPKYAPAVFEISRNSLYLPNMKEIIKPTYFSNGYFEVFSNSYFDIYDKKIHIEINSGMAFKIGEVSVDSYCVDFSTISQDKIDKAKKVVKSLFDKNSGIYSHKKIQGGLNILNQLCQNLDYYVTVETKKDLEKKEVEVNFVFKKKNIAFKKTLTSIKCSGTSKISSSRIMSVLNKKLGDMISTDDLHFLKSLLLASGCFTYVNIQLIDENNGYLLNIDVKEGPLFSLTNCGITPYPEFGVNLGCGKKNIFDSGRNLDFYLGIQSPSESSNQSLFLRFEIDQILPNGKPFSFGFAAMYSGKIKNLFSKDGEKKCLIFDQESGGRVYGYLTSEFLGFDHCLEFGYKYFTMEDKGSVFGSVKTNVVNYSRNQPGSHFSFKLDNEIFLFLMEPKNPTDKIEIKSEYCSCLADSDKIIFRVIFQTGHVLAFEYSDLKKHRLFQYLDYSDLGVWGPISDNVIIGADSKIGINAAVEYIIPLSGLTDFVQSLHPYVAVEAGSIFNLKDQDVSENFISGASLGVKIPFLGGQMTIKLFYFIPLHNNSGDFLTKKGFNCGFDFDLAKIISF
ncbi:POTRA domain-containing protein [Alphaproteobacteria bacterium endosymbiont of Tiliacea citrago]|uniref:POTRA domain-containing protein n=1 Tax=Alphaproteobacteria bacterium endosymbiont of Tiliacea citrago TaxID=3077944 RepID=UPI00313F11DB